MNLCKFSHGKAFEPTLKISCIQTNTAELSLRISTNSTNRYLQRIHLKMKALTDCIMYCRMVKHILVP